MGRRPSAWACVRTVSTFTLGFGLGFVLHIFASVTYDMAREGDGSGYNSAEYQMAGLEAWLGVANKPMSNISTSSQAPDSTQHHPRGTDRNDEGGGEEGDDARGYGGGPKILCYILAGPSTHKKAIHVKHTWGQRCDRTIIFSTQKDPKLDTEVLQVREGYNYLWIKTKAALTRLHTHYPDYDWYMKADDDTFVIVENLRYFLSEMNSSDPVYYGVKFKHHVKQGYMSGGGGYVLSREGVRRFVTKALLLEDQERCPNMEETGAEDMLLGQCLEAVGVAAGDSRDGDGKPRFFSHSPMSLFYKAPLVNRLHWYWRYIWHKHDVGPDCCSPDLVSFHDVDPRMMWTLETLLYRVHIHRDLQPPALNTSTSPAPP